MLTKQDKTLFAKYLQQEIDSLEQTITELKTIDVQVPDSKQVQYLGNKLQAMKIVKAHVQGVAYG